jgi:hypothetical protein
MPAGRRRIILTLEERKAIRRQKVRAYVQAHRQRKKELEASQSRSPSQTENASFGDSENQSGSLLSETYESGWDFETVKDIFPIPRPSLNKEPKFPINLPFKIAFGPNTTNAFLAVFPGSSLPITGQASTDGPHQIKVAIYFSFWTTRFSYDIDSAEGEILNDAIVGTALQLISIEKDDQELSVRALDLQTRSLRKLRDGFDAYLQDKESRNFFLLSATALIFLASELLVTKSWLNFSQHLSGIGALIEHSGPGCLNSVAAQDNLFGYRSLQLLWSLMNRRGSFLSQSEWCYFPGRKEHRLGNHPLHKLINIAYQIPALMEAFDDAQERPLPWLNSQIHDLLRIESQLDLWKSMLPETYSQSHFATVPPVWKGLHSESIEFCNPMAAVCFTLFAGVKVTVEVLLLQHLQEAKQYDASPYTPLIEKANESFSWARIVCQCLEYFFAHDRRIVGNGFALYSFAAAWQTFAELNRKHDMDLEMELSWCKETANKRLEDFELATLGKQKRGFGIIQMVLSKVLRS